MFQGLPKGITVRKNGRRTELERNEVECDLAKAAYNGTEPSTKDGKVLAGKLKDVVGHDSEAMRRNYTKFDVKRRRQALDKLPDLLG